MNLHVFKSCPWCNSTDIAVESEQIVDRIVTGVDEDNGPVYWAECQHCGARSPLVSWAADAIPKWNERDDATLTALDEAVKRGQRHEDLAVRYAREADENARTANQWKAERDEALALVRVAQSQRDDAWKSERYLLARLQELRERYEPKGEP